MKTKSLILSTGLAMFSMFFGSGNLVFPLVVGQQCEGHFLSATLGLLLTGVLVPFLGILAILLFNGNPKDFFSQLGKPATFWFPLIALSLMGPFGVLARCITVAHGAFNLLIPGAPLTGFSAGACLIIFILAVSKKKIVSLLGSILTPLLLASLAAIAAFGLSHAEFPSAEPQGQIGSFLNGLYQGYQTMDLLAAFFFSAFLIQHLKKQSDDSLPIFLKSSLIGASLLSIIYTLLILLGFVYSDHLAPIPPQEMLGFIAELTLGDWAAPIVAATVILACFTTAIVLASLSADFLKKEICNHKINTPLALSAVLAIAFGTSTLEFSGIAKILGPILEVLYPALIVLTIVSILNRLWGWNSIRMPIAVAFVAKLLSRVI